MVSPILRFAGRSHAGRGRIPPEQAGRERSGWEPPKQSETRPLPGAPMIFAHFLSEKRNPRYDRRRHESKVRNHISLCGQVVNWTEPGKKLFLPRDHDNPLKGLISDERIQENPNVFWSGPLGPDSRARKN